jgi:transcription elongation GreA/GreB family factor
MPLRNTSIGPPTPTPNGPVLTAAAAEMLAAEVERLRALRDEEFTARRREALAVSGSDEDAHLAIGEDEGVSNARIANLEALLRHATVVAHEPAGDDLAGIGSTVTVEDVASGRRHDYVLVAWHDGAARGTVSAASPVGQAILGRGVGDEASIELPGGRDRRLRIVAVQQAVPAGP